MSEKEQPKPIKRLKSLLTTENLWLYILSILEKNETYAYRLDGEIEEKHGFKPNKILIYVVLYKLESEGLISSKYRERRKYYQMSEKGREALKLAREYLKELSGKL
ncbi:PadR family transcriptional regulator [Candidatus Micrarchaeota archaeon]|nr:PadR family transcriptional regulator [Candidatus Micrarchaeota archaeon]